jgi:predicted ATP-grasp superfamily ATP-dependent carboligase
MVQIVLRDLDAAARIQERSDTLTPDPECALRLVAIRSAIAELRTVAAPAPAPDA